MTESTYCWQRTIPPSSKRRSGKLSALLAELAGPIIDPDTHKVRDAVATAVTALEPGQKGKQIEGRMGRVYDVERID